MPKNEYRPRIVIFLQSAVEAFTVQDELVGSLAASLNNLDFLCVRSESELLKELPEAHALVSWRIPVEWYAVAPKLREVFTPAAGRDWISRPPATNPTVTIHHGTFHGNVMSESLLGMIIFFNKRMEDFFRSKRMHQWNRNRIGDNPSLGSQTVLILGYGSIGRMCSRVLKAFGCHITGMKRSGRHPEYDRDADEIITAEKLPEFLPRADHIVALLPGDTDTDKLLTRRHFQLMKPTACFYNLGRGNCVVEDDLIDALCTGRIAGAGLDVFANEPLPPTSQLWDLPNVFIMPHASAISADYLPLYFEELRDRLRHVFPAES